MWMADEYSYFLIGSYVKWFTEYLILFLYF